MKQGQLIPRAPRHWRMKQLPKATWRWRAELAEAQLALRRAPRWWRLWHRAFARVVETEPDTAAAMPQIQTLQDTP